MREGLATNRHEPGLALAAQEPRPRASCTVVACITAVLVDTAFLVVLVALLPVLVAVLGIVCFLPVLERLAHPCREYMDGLSTAFINHVDGAVIHGVLVSKRPVKAEVVFGSFQATYLSPSRPEFARFRQRVVRRGLFWPYWTDASAAFDASHHFRACTQPIGKDELELRLGAIQAEPLDFSRPVWELHHFENYTDENGVACSATLFRLHHAMADGFTGMRVLMQGARPNKPPEGAQQGRAQRRAPLGCCRLLHYWLASVRKLLFMQADPPSAFKAAAHTGPRDPKVVAWTTLQGITVADLKVIGKGLGGATVNDILMAALSGALRSYAAGSPGACDVTTSLWVSLSPLKHIYTDFKELPLRWGNASLGAVYLRLPTAAQHSRDSPQALLAQLRSLTEDPALLVEAGVATKLVSLLGWVPKAVGGALWGPLTNKVSVSMSNMPGPQFDFEWCGSPIRSLLFFVPPTGTISVFVTVATFNGEVNVGMAADGALLKAEALRLVTGDLFRTEIQRLRCTGPGETGDR